ncbi:iron chelate uptake ABC transporter family permease subunit [Agromyces bracchium]
MRTEPSVIERMPRAAAAPDALARRGARDRVVVALARPGVRLALLAALAAASVAVFVFVGIEGSWAFAVPFRLRKVAAMLLVAVAIGVSTVLFQTITGNRILSPAIMGFDALYVLIQTVVVFAFGAGALATTDPNLMWLVEVGAMVVFSGLLFRWVFARSARSVHLLVLVGIVFGVLFRSVSSFMQRMLDPAAFAVLQDSFFASFTGVDETLLGISAVAVVTVTAVAVPLVRRLDVLLLGESHAIGLGVDHRRTVAVVLVLVAVLVSVSTALVGPVAFFGLLVANLAYLVVGSFRHAATLPAAVLLGVICLVGGQFLLEQLGLGTALSVVIEFVGGIVFILMLVRKGVR